MKTRMLGLVCALFLTGCPSVPTPPPGAIVLADEVFVEALEPGVWRHVSYRKFSGVPFPSNGLVVRGASGAILVDTAWNDAQTAVILDWVEREVGPVVALLITHAHDDRIGGIAEAHARGIESVAIARTAELARAAGWPEPKRIVSSPFSLAPFGVAGELFFPGEGHTADNVVVYFDEHALLAGTCMVRGLEWRLGNLADATMEAWPASIAAIQARYPEVRTVVPGHGAPGDARLLAHTAALLAEDPLTADLTN